MKVLVVGSGGREHSLCWKLSQSPHLTHLSCAPGNSGIAQHAECVPISAEDSSTLVQFATENEVALVVIGPEAPLERGIADKLRKCGVRSFGASREAAKLEWSKAYAKVFMARHNIPTAPWRVVRNEEECWRAVQTLGLPVVVKKDRLAAGKGVYVTHHSFVFREALQQVFDPLWLQGAPHLAVVERFLPGIEMSVTALVDGKTWIVLPDSMDYKQIYVHDKGPNTGGMGTHSPSGIMNPVLEGKLASIVKKTVEGLQEEEIDYRGVLYIGIMVVDGEPYVLEYNTRFGDPECQSLMVRIKSDLLPVLAAGADGNFGDEGIDIHNEMSATVVLASMPYPEEPVTGENICGPVFPCEQENFFVFHAGTRSYNGDRVISAGGRVLNTSARGKDLEEAITRAYIGAEKFSWPHMYVRPDIGHRVLKTTCSTS